MFRYLDIKTDGVSVFSIREQNKLLSKKKFFFFEWYFGIVSMRYSSIADSSIVISLKKHSEEKSKFYSFVGIISFEKFKPFLRANIIYLRACVSHSPISTGPIEFAWMRNMSLKNLLGNQKTNKIVCVRDWSWSTSLSVLSRRQISNVLIFRIRKRKR